MENRQRREIWGLWKTLLSDGEQLRDERLGVEFHFLLCFTLSPSGAMDVVGGFVCVGFCVGWFGVSARSSPSSEMFPQKRRFQPGISPPFFFRFFDVIAVNSFYV